MNIPEPSSKPAARDTRGTTDTYQCMYSKRSSLGGAERST